MRSAIDRLCGGRLRCARDTLRSTTRPAYAGAPPGVSLPPGIGQAAAGSSFTSTPKQSSSSCKGGGGGPNEVLNVVLSDLPLCSSLAQCVVCGLDGDILAANVYSSWQSDTASVLQQIMTRFGAAGTSFVCVQRVTGCGGETNGRAAGGGGRVGAAGGPTGRAHAARTAELTKACRSVSFPPRTQRLSTNSVTAAA